MQFRNLEEIQEYIAVLMVERAAKFPQPELLEADLEDVEQPQTITQLLQLRD